MKKLFTLILSGIVITYSASGQALPNPGFENWTAHSGYDDPDFWHTLNSATSILGVVTASKSTDAHSGTYSVKGETKFIGAPFNQTAPALITTGTINTTTQVIEGGIAYTLRPDSVVGWINYTPTNIDTGYIEVLLMNADASDTIARAKFEQTVATNGWYHFKAPFEYYSASDPELSRVILLPSSGYSPVVGSIVQFDDLDFIFNPAGVNDNAGKGFFRVYPNPATEELFIKNPGTESAKMQVFDVAGKKVTELNIGLNTTRTNISTYSPGLYLYTFTGNNSEILHTGKFVVTR